MLAEALAVGLDDVSVPVGAALAAALVVVLVLAEPETLEEGVAEPVHGAAAEDAESATPMFAGTTKSAPIAIVPVATAPTTEAADRFFRACLATGTSPNYCRPSVHSDHAPRRAHCPTVTNPAPSGHPPDSG